EPDGMLRCGPGTSGLLKSQGTSALLSNQRRGLFLGGRRIPSGKIFPGGGAVLHLLHKKGLESRRSAAVGPNQRGIAQSYALIQYWYFSQNEFSAILKSDLTMSGRTERSHI